MPLMRVNMGQQQAPRRSNDAGRDKPKLTYEQRKSRASLSSINVNNNGNKSSLASYGSEVKLTTTFKIANKKDNSPACFKQDGKRFSDEQTLKLYASMDYQVQMDIDQFMELLFIKFGGIEIPFKEVKTNSNGSSSDDKATQSSSSYQFMWSTKGIEPTLSHHRTDIPCSMKFKNFKEIEFKLQVKFYTEQQIKQATWGETLNKLAMECVAGRGMYNSYVVKMNFH